MQYILSEKNVVSQIFGSLPFWSVLIAAAVIIGIGYFFQRKKIIFKDWEKVIVKIVVLVALPALILKSFMVDVDTKNTQQLKENFILLLIGMIFYILVTFGSKLFFPKKEHSVQDTLSMSVAFASNIYFGLPILKALYPDNASQIDMYASMFNVGYWIFMSSVAVYIIRRKVETHDITHKEALEIKKHHKVEVVHNGKIKLSTKMTKDDFLGLLKNPIIIATIVGFVIWITQLIPGIKVVPSSYHNAPTNENYSPLRIDLLIPGVDQILNILKALAIPLAWFAVGALMAKTDLKKAFTNKLAWWATIVKNIITPAILLAIIVIFAKIGVATGDYQITNISAILMMTMVAAPMANTIVSYTIAYNKEPELACSVASQTIVFGVISIPFWVIISSLVAETSLFLQI